MKRWIGLALILVPFLASAASFWDGNAALQRGDAAFEGGMFAASNSFAPDTQILVQNLETGKAATVTITKRVDGQSDILVLLSPAAASALGISAGTLASVRVTVPPKVSSAASAVPAEQALSSDPDLNPGAAYGGATTPAATQTASTAAPDQAQAAAAGTEPSATEPVESSPSLESLPETSAPAIALAPSDVPSSAPDAPAAEQPAAQTAASEESRKAAEDAAILAEAESRTPQKDVFLPPREDRIFAYQPPPVETTPPPQAAPAEPQITAVIGEPEAAPAAAPEADAQLAEAAAPQESRPQEIVGADTTAPAQDSGSAAMALAAPDVVAEEAPPRAAQPVQTEVTDPAVAPPAAPVETAIALAAPDAPAPQQPAAQTQSVQQASTSAVAVAALPPTRTQPALAAPSKGAQIQTYYVQLAAYTTEKGAQDLASTLSPTYPALVLAPAASGARMFRVVVGPLNKAESGTLLVWFRFRGFPDAFVKQE